MQTTSFILRNDPSPILSSWKDIARFFGKGVRTVQRWEKHLGMPVHRPGHNPKILFCDPEELRRWALGVDQEVDNESAAASS